MFKKKLKLGFSLAEALVTMLVMMLIIIASTNIITKRKIQNYNIKGHWECIYDPVTKRYSQVSIHHDGKTEEFGEVLADGCLFHPQVGAKSYSVNVIGGGGGGASSASDTDFVIARDNFKTFIPEFTGDYEVITVGAGGIRGDDDGCHNFSYSGGGGAGQVQYRTINLVKDRVYTLVPGARGHYNSSPAGASQFKHGTSVLLNAQPGRTGQRRDRDTFLGVQVDCRWRSDKDAGNSISPHLGYKPFAGESTYNSRNPDPGEICYTDSSKISCRSKSVTLTGDNLKAALFLEDIGDLTAGKGGNGSRNVFVSNPGLVALRFAGLYAGGGGSAGKHVNRTIKKISGDVKIKIGNGGEGAYVEYSHGQPGEPTTFGDLIIVSGGSGGITRAVVGKSEQAGVDFLAGLNGEKSVFGGFLKSGIIGKLNGQVDMDNGNDGLAMPTPEQYGAGGAGGAAVACTMEAKLDPDKRRNCWGKGGHGMPGFVSVDWY